MASAPRPLSVTIIAWLLIIGGVFGAVSTPWTYKMMKDPAFLKTLEGNPEALKQVQNMTTFDMVLGVVTSGVGAVAGIFMLQGAGWSRWLYAGLCVVSFGQQIVKGNANVMMIPGLLIVALIFYFLFSAKANAFFKGKDLPTQMPQFGG